MSKPKHMVVVPLAEHAQYKVIHRQSKAHRGLIGTVVGLCEYVDGETRYVKVMFRRSMPPLFGVSRVYNEGCFIAAHKIDRLTLQPNAIDPPA